MKFGSVILNWRQKGNPRNDVFLSLPERKHSKRLSISKAKITVQWDWRSDSCGCDARRGDIQLWHTSGCWEEIRKWFRWVHPHLNPAEILPQHHRARPLKFECSGSRQRILLDSVIPSTLQHCFEPWRMISMGSMFETNGYLVHSENLATWAGKDMLWIRCEVKPSHFLVCNCCDLGTNIYWEKIWGITFWAALVHSHTWVCTHSKTQVLYFYGDSIRVAV
jgi:hypothetical protein